MLHHPHFFANFRWQDAIDIAISSYILFRLYMLFKGTNVMRVLIGIALLMFFGSVANYLGLIVTSWAIQGVTAAAAFVIIVIFRNEIRNILEAQNLKAYFWGTPRKLEDPPVEVLVDTAFELARLHIGALIVVPGKENIRSIIQGGIPWRGLLSKEMLMSIFWHNNPVHDGAVIVSGNQISEVMAILPLSKRTDLSSYYGTRHRAAIGMSEASDALVLVVSEERGVVAVAKGNQIRAVSRKEDLTNILNEHLGMERKNGYSRREILEVGVTALVSVLVVFGIWFNLVKGKTTLLTVDAPIKFVNNAPGMEILESTDNTARLQLSGSDQLMRSFRPDQVQVRLDLSTAHVGANTIRITDDDVSLPPGISLNRVDPASIMIVLDRRIVKKVPVQVTWNGKIPAGHVLQSFTVNPEYVEISGMSLALKDVQFVATQPVDRTQMTESGSVSVIPLLPSASLSFAQGNIPKITISYVVTAKKTKKK